MAPKSSIVKISVSPLSLGMGRKQCLQVLASDLSTPGPLDPSQVLMARHDVPNNGREER